MMNDNNRFNPSFPPPTGNGASFQRQRLQPPGFPPPSSAQAETARGFQLGQNAMRQAPPRQNALAPWSLPGQSAPGPWSPPPSESFPHSPQRSKKNRHLLIGSLVMLLVLL